MTKEQHAFIVANYKGVGNKELTEMFNNHFGTDYKLTRIRNYKKNHKLSSGLTGYYKKGEIPFNKGLKRKEWMSEDMIEKVNKTCFRKGNIPHNHHHIGYEVITDGYFMTKVAEPDVWKYKQILVWEDYHKKKVPKGMLVTFLDGDKRNFNIDNLMLISRRENARMNLNNSRYADTELTKSVVGITRLEIAIRERGK